MLTIYPRRRRLASSSKVLLRPNRGDGRNVHPVVHPLATALPFEETGIVEHLEMVADRGLGHTDRVDQFAGADFAARGDQGEQAETGRIGQRLEAAGEVVGIGGGEAFFEDRGAADGHEYILTEIDVSVKIHRWSSIGGSL